MWFDHDVMNLPVNVNTFRTVESRNYQTERRYLVMASYTLYIKTYCMSVCLYRGGHSFIGALLKKEKKFTESAPGRLALGERLVHMLDITDTNAYRSGEPNRRAMADLAGA